MSKVSVLIPIFNSRDYIGKVIESVLSQNFGGFESILIYNQSTNGDYRILGKIVSGVLITYYLNSANYTFK